MKKVLLAILLITTAQGVFARETDPQWFTASLCETRCITFTGGTTTSTINTDTGALENSITPTFCMRKNSRADRNLILTIAANSQSGEQNAVFEEGGQRYVIFTNSDSLPALSSITDVKSSSRQAVNNPDVIAYKINDPEAVPSRLNVTYQSAQERWRLRVIKRGKTESSITIPAGAPLAETFSYDDGEGDYEATITISFI